jgi:hydroxymethylbilane synthase
MMRPQRLRIATRASELALWQSRYVGCQLEACNPGLTVELLSIVTSGDRILDQPLAKIGGKGLFVKELEQALADGRADLAVHSMKDVPAELPPEFHITAILVREDPRDTLVSRDGRALADLALGSRIGTSSLRRRSQLLAARPDLDITDLRGNVPTRLRRLSEGAYDAIVLASAGLIRLGLFTAACRPFELTEMLPAVAQGAIGIECRRGDPLIEALTLTLNDPATSECVRAERAMNAILGGNCQVPIAGYAELAHGQITLRGLVAAVDGSEIVRQTASGPRADAERIGESLGEALLAAGARRILHNDVQ